jgi:hypothetical protein
MTPLQEEQLISALDTIAEQLTQINLKLNPLGSLVGLPTILKALIPPQGQKPR